MSAEEFGERLSQAISIEEWKPRTKLGWLVKEGNVTSLKEIFDMNMKIKEPEIVDALLGRELQHEIIDINMVQKMTDAGRITRFRVVVVVGNQNGFVGLGVGKARQLRMAVDKAIMDAKLNIIPVRRGCGSFECGCSEPHSIPYQVRGKAGSVEVVLKPAPKGAGLVAGDTAKVVLRYAGIRDIWSWSRGKTSTTINFAMAVFDALKKAYRFVTVNEWGR
ncbi:MAG: 30S ribosomal protein S5 [Desulfurococcales archaeon]|nr:30S ribosomal protein S5 [Desulfurococcales archaeon]